MALHPDKFLLLPLERVAPAAAGGQVGCQAEVTGRVLETS